MNELIGWAKSLKTVVNEIVRNLDSNYPFLNFAIQGDRRSGRSLFFKNVAMELNEHYRNIHCFVGETKESGLVGFVSTIQEIVNKSDYETPKKEKLNSVNEFFELISNINSSSNKRPVFLIDMGAVLDNSDIDQILELGYYIRKIVSLQRDKNIPFVLGLGWTPQFFNKIVTIAGDIFRDRYRTLLTLGCGFEEDPPFKAFQNIVKKVSDVNLDEKFSGLLRVPGITAGKYAENLISHKIEGEAKPEEIWKSLQGDWKIINSLSFEDIRYFDFSDLAKLLLADGSVEENVSSEYLTVNLDEKFNASDKLYEKFNLFPPRRDPTLKERIANRLSDQEDSKLSEEIATSIRDYLKDIGSDQNYTHKLHHDRSCSLTSTLMKQPNSDIFIEKLFPKKLFVGLYLDSPDEEEFLNSIYSAVRENAIVVVLYPEGRFNIEATSVGRKINQLKYPWLVNALNIEDIVLLISNIDKVKKNQVIEQLIDSSINHHIIKRPIVPVLIPNCRKMLLHVVGNAGRLEIEQLQEKLSLSKKDTTICIKKLVDSEIFKKSRGVVEWDPCKDVLLKILLKGESENAIHEKLSTLFSIPDSDIDTELLKESYQGIFGNSDLSNWNEKHIIEWYYLFRPQLIDKLNDLLSNEPEIQSLYKNEIDSLSDGSFETIENWDHIASDRTNIFKIKNEIENKITTIIKERELEIHELELVKSELRKSIGQNEDCFSLQEKENILSQIDNIRSRNSRNIRDLKSKLTKRKNLLLSLDERISECESLINNLKNGKYKKQRSLCDDRINQAKQFREDFDFDASQSELNKIENDLQKIIKEIKKQQLFGKKLKRRKKVPIEGSNKSEEKPHKNPDVPHTPPRVPSESKDSPSPSQSSNEDLGLPPLPPDVETESQDSSFSSQPMSGDSEVPPIPTSVENVSENSFPPSQPNSEDSGVPPLPPGMDSGKEEITSQERSVNDTDSAKIDNPDNSIEAPKINDDKDVINDAQKSSESVNVEKFELSNDDEKLRLLQLLVGESEHEIVKICATLEP